MNRGHQAVFHDSDTHHIQLINIDHTKPQENIEYTLTGFIAANISLESWLADGAALNL
jgi:hypothetical protein